MCFLFVASFSCHFAVCLVLFVVLLFFVIVVSVSCSKSPYEWECRVEKLGGSPSCWRARAREMNTRPTCVSFHIPPCPTQCRCSWTPASWVQPACEIITRVCHRPCCNDSSSTVKLGERGRDTEDIRHQRIRDERLFHTPVWVNFAPQKQESARIDAPNSQVVTSWIGCRWDIWITWLFPAQKNRATQSRANIVSRLISWYCCACQMRLLHEVRMAKSEGSTRGSYFERSKLPHTKGFLEFPNQGLIVNWV